MTIPDGTVALTGSDLDAALKRTLEKLQLQPKPAHDWTRWTPYILAAWVFVSGIAGFVFKDTINTLSETSRIAAEAKAGVDRIDRDRGARIAKTDQIIGGIQDRIAELPLMKGSITRLDEARVQMSNQLENGRQERTAADRQQAKDTADNGTKIALLTAAQDRLAEEIKQLRQTVEAQGRSPSGPFRRRTTKETGPSLAFSLKPRGVFRGRSSRRSPIFLAELTRSLERSFGKPTYRGPYWSSLAWRRR